MGLILSAKCPCGVEAEVVAGSGMLEGSACLPAWCKARQRLDTARAQSRRPRCKQCRGALQLLKLFDSPELREEVTEAPLPCPRCGEPTLRFEPIGLWD